MKVWIINTRLIISSCKGYWFLSLCFELVNFDSSFIFSFLKIMVGNVPGGPVVKILCFQCRGAWVWSPVRELRSDMLYGVARKNNLKIMVKHSNPGIPWWLSSKESACNAGGAWDAGSIPGLGKSPGGGHGNTPVFLPGEFQEQRNLATTVHWVPKNWKQLKRLSIHACTHIQRWNLSPF